jgi:hypothetical protein
MRFAAAAVPAILLLAGACYFFAKAKGDAGGSASDARSLQASAPLPAGDLVADESDRELVRSLIERKNLTNGQADALLEAAGRRYIRRKLAFDAAKRAVDAGTAPPGELEPLRSEMEAARRVCDAAERLGRPNRDMEAIAQADWEMEKRLAYFPSGMTGLAEHYEGGSPFGEADLEAMGQAFFKIWPMPVSTRGESAVHRSMGFDHRGRFDVALSPSQPQGVWARRYLTEKHVTFFAFRSAVPGKATGAHIHIGPASTRRVPKS